MVDGRRPRSKYLGPGNELTRRRIRELSGAAASLKEHRDLVRMLRNLRLPAPDLLSGEILSVLAKAGLFRLRGVVIGSITALSDLVFRMSPRWSTDSLAC